MRYSLCTPFAVEGYSESKTQTKVMIRYVVLAFTAPTGTMLKVNRSIDGPVSIVACQSESAQLECAHQFENNYPY